MSELTVGERNHNPGNLRFNANIKWLGEANPPWDARGYCVFVDDAHGLRALCVDLHTKWKRGLDTVTKIISPYAPPSENDTVAYIKDVCARLGIGPDDKVNLGTEDELTSFAEAVIIHENGHCNYTPDILVEAATEALHQGEST